MKVVGGPGWVAGCNQWDSAGTSRRCSSYCLLHLKIMLTQTIKNSHKLAFLIGGSAEGPLLLGSVGKHW